MCILTGKAQKYCHICYRKTKYYVYNVLLSLIFKKTTCYDF